MYRKVKIHFSSILKCGWIIARVIMFWMEGLGELRRRRKCGSQLFLRKARAQDMGQLKFTMHWLPSAMKQNMHKCNKATKYKCN